MDILVIHPLYIPYMHIYFLDMFHVHKKNINIYGYISYTFLTVVYIPYMHICFLDMFHVFSLVCFLIYGVKRRQVLIAKPRFYFKISRFTTSIFLSIILWVFIKINVFLNKSRIPQPKNSKFLFRGVVGYAFNMFLLPAPHKTMRIRSSFCNMVGSRHKQCKIYQ